MGLGDRAVVAGQGAPPVADGARLVGPMTEALFWLMFVLAATFGPVSLAVNVCLLVDRHRRTKPTGRWGS